MTDDSLLKDGPDASRKDPSKQKGILGAFLQFLFCLLLVAAADLVLFTGLAVQAAPEFAAWTALLLVFPVLPAGWHMGAERLRQTAPGGGFRRFGFRSAAIALIVLGTAAATPGPRIVTNSVSKFHGCPCLESWHANRHTTSGWKSKLRAASTAAAGAVRRKLGGSRSWRDRGCAVDALT
jgi:hypothetical protein